MDYGGKGFTSKSWRRTRLKQKSVNKGANNIKQMAVFLFATLFCHGVEGMTFEIYSSDPIYKRKIGQQKLMYLD